MGTTISHCGRVIVAFLIGAAVATASRAEKPLSTVADLRYGVVLYDYFQSNHFDALSELMVAKERGGIKGHQDNPELIEGSLNLAFGMDRRAGEIYNRLLDENKPLEIRNAAWFYLSKIRYQRGENDAVRESLANIQQPISTDLADELESMAIQLLLRERKYAEAQERLSNASSRVKLNGQFQYWLPYLQFNIGAVLSRYEKPDEAKVFFSKVVEARLAEKNHFHDEQLAMYDKAFTALGYTYFQQENYQQAIKEFQSVRQATPLANDALLGYGWAKAKLDDFRGALVPWTFLSQRPLADDAVQEALIAIPYAYLQLGDINKALASYQRAEDIYIQELANIDQAGIELLGKSIVDILDLDNLGTTYSWLAPENNTLVTPPSRYLLPLLSLNRFQNSVQTLTDLHRIRRRLEAWKIDLDAYGDLMDYRLKTFRLQQEPEGYRDMSAELDLLKTQRDQLLTVVAQARQQQDVFLLLDEDRKDLLDMVEDGERSLQQLNAAGEASAEEAVWLKRYRGLLLWSASQDFDDRLWQVESQLKAINETLLSADAANTKIQQLLSDAPDISSAQKRINDYVIRVDNLLASNDGVMAGIEAELRAQLFTALALQRQRVQFYLGESRLAVAQLYDNQYLERAKQQ